MDLNVHGCAIDNAFYRLPFGRCVRRVDWIAEQCVGRAVLDIGCVDETAIATKADHGKWVHGELAVRANAILGVDNTPRLAELKARFPHLFESIVGGSLEELQEICQRMRFAPDLIVCAELIEHLPEPAMMFRLVAPILRQTGGRLIVTTPNPFAYQSFLMSLLGRESQHIDHTCILSAKIQMRAARKAGLELEELRTAYTEYSEFMARPGPWKYVLRALDTLVFRPGQWLFSAVAGTLITVWKAQE
jgi:2-polyprenyl-3-methyl-5-hydroxy-6-metoxy-1,4-benzoquinol methylase